MYGCVRDECLCVVYVCMHESMYECLWRFHCMCDCLSNFPPPHPNPLPYPPPLATLSACLKGLHFQKIVFFYRYPLIFFINQNKNYANACKKYHSDLNQFASSPSIIERLFAELLINRMQRWIARLCELNLQISLLASVRRCWFISCT